MNYFSKSGTARNSTASETIQSPVAPVTLPEALRQRIVESVNATFSTQGTFPDFSIEQQLTTGVFSADIEALRKPASALDRREGALIEAAVAYAMTNSGKYVCRPSAPVELYREAFNVVDANQGSSIDALMIHLPLFGAATSRVKIDMIAIDPTSGAVYLLDVKRSSSGVTDDHMRTLKAAAFTVRASLMQCGINVTKITPQLVVWWGDPNGLHVTRETVDASFGVPIRGLVDAVVREYRIQVSARIAKLWGAKAPAASDVAGSDQRLPQAEIEKLTRALASLDLPIMPKVAPHIMSPAKKRGRPRKMTHSQ